MFLFLRLFKHFYCSFVFFITFSKIVWVSFTKKYCNPCVENYLLKCLQIMFGRIISENLSDDREDLNDFLEEAELQQYYEFFR